MRAGYLLLVVGLGVTVWPTVVNHAPWTLWQGVGKSVLTAIWLISVPLPLWLAHTPIDAETADTLQACLVPVIFLFLIPWRYVFANYLLQPGDRWK